MVTNDQQEPEYHDVVTYRRLAELVGLHAEGQPGPGPAAHGSLDGSGRRPAAAAGRDRGVGAVPESGVAAGGGGLMAEQPTSASCWSSCQLAEHVEEVRRKQAEVARLLPWLIADPFAGGSPGADELSADRADRASPRPPRGRGAGAGDRELTTARKRGGRVAASPCVLSTHPAPGS